MIRTLRHLILILCIIPFQLNAQNDKTSNSTYNYSLKELSELTVTTGSIKKEKRSSAPSNITIVTQQMIEERGYKTLVEICQDIPGFDFSVFNDGAGEYSTFNMNRGMGDVGNPEILVMIDNIVQNNISYNWSLLWSYEHLLIDVERIEIIQGPGSVMYGSQAFTGVIHIITKKNFNGLNANAWYGSGSTRASELHVGTKLWQDVNFSFAFRNYSSKGDGGINRYDPGSYFKNIQHPSTITKDYDAEGNFIENQTNPVAGKKLTNGFNTINNSFSVRSKINYKNTEFGFFLSDYTRGYGSANVAYEYDLTDGENTTHFTNYHFYLQNAHTINTKLTLNSHLVYRVTNIIPDGGFKYLYQFPNERKSYAGYSNQSFLEERLLYDLNENNNLSFGLKLWVSKESDRIVSLGEYPDSKTSTNSSWDIAEEGGGLNMYKAYPQFWVHDIAGYALWDHDFQNNFSSSFGVRYDYNSEFGGIINPRFALDYNPSPSLGAKLIYGKAFRQPSIYELQSEFRGNANLVPQRIQTSELEIHSLLFENKLSMELNIYLSNINNTIGKVSDPNMPSGERFENIGKINIAGLSFASYYQLNKNIRTYFNYNFLTGISDDNSFYEIDRTAKHKVNAGINVKSFQRKLITDFRLNYVGKRKAPEANTWLQTYENGYAPSYLKANLVVSYLLSSKLTAQVILNNVLNTKYYGIGRESGSGFIDDYDYINNINPTGFSPAYHPQAPTTAFVSLIYKLHQK